MSKPIARVVLVSLVSLVLIAAAYMTVQGVFAKAEITGAQTHVVSGLQTNFNHDRSTVPELESLQTQSEAQPGAGRHQGAGGCEDEMQTSPLD